MTKQPITNADTITFLQERLKVIDNDRARLVQAINLLTATELVAQANQTARMPSKASLSRVKGRRNTRLKEKLPWAPSSNASPFTQNVYDILEDGSSLTGNEVYARIVRLGHQVTIHQVNSALNWMKRSGRLTLNSKGQYRRKHARLPVEPDVVEAFEDEILLFPPDDKATAASAGVDNKLIRVEGDE